MVTGSNDVQGERDLIELGDGLDEKEMQDLLDRYAGMTEDERRALIERNIQEFVDGEAGPDPIQARRAR